MKELLNIATFLYLLSFFVLLFGQIGERGILKRIGKWMFILAFLSEVVYFLLRTYKTFQLGYDYLPITNAFDSFIFFTLSLAFLQTLFIKKAHEIIVILSAILISVTLLSLSLAGFNSQIEPLIPALKSNWLVAHVLTSFLAYGAFAINFLLSTYNLMLSEEKNHRIVGCVIASILFSSLLVVILKKVFDVNMLVSSLPLFFLVFFGFLFLSTRFKPFKNRELLKQTTMFGLILLTIGIITGSVWAKYAWGAYWSWDPKETWSLITWIVYLINLHFMYLRNKSTEFLSYLGVVGFISVLITYLGVNFILPGLHSYGSQ